MSDINPNTPVTENSEPTVAAGDSTPVSFDELDQIMTKSKDKRPGKEAKPKEEKSEPKEKKEPKEKEDLDAKDKQEDLPKRKTYKAKHQDKELELDEDAMVSVKVDGKDVEVPIKDLLGNYSGKVAWDKKFSELAKEKLEFRKSNEGLSKDKELIRQIFTSEDPSIRMFKMAELAGVSPMEFRKAYYDENIKLLEQYANMSDDERKAADLEFENQYLRYQTETRDKSLASQQAQAELKRRTDEVLAAHAIKADEFVDYYDKLSKLADENGNIPVTRQGTQTNERLTPELISEIITKDRLWFAAEAAFGELKLNWDKERQTKTLIDLVDSAYQNGIKTSDLPDIVSEIYGSKKAQKVIAEKLKDNQEFKDLKKVQTPKPQSPEPMFFDEI